MGRPVQHFDKRQWLQHVNHYCTLNITILRMNTSQHLKFAATYLRIIPYQTKGLFCTRRMPPASSLSTTVSTHIFAAVWRWWPCSRDAERRRTDSARIRPGRRWLLLAAEDFLPRSCFPWTLLRAAGCSDHCSLTSGWHPHILQLRRGTHDTIRRCTPALPCVKHRNLPHRIWD